MMSYIFAQEAEMLIQKSNDLDFKIQLISLQFNYCLRDFLKIVASKLVLKIRQSQRFRLKILFFPVICQFLIYGPFLSFV